MMNTQTTESVDPGQDSFTVTIDPAKLDAENRKTLGRFLDDDALEKLAGGDSHTVTIHRGTLNDEQWQNWKNAVTLAAMSGGN